MWKGEVYLRANVEKKNCIPHLSRENIDDDEYVAKKIAIECNWMKK